MQSKGQDRQRHGRVTRQSVWSLTSIPERALKGAVSQNCFLTLPWALQFGSGKGPLSVPFPSWVSIIFLSECVLNVLGTLLRGFSFVPDFTLCCTSQGSALESLMLGIQLSSSFPLNSAFVGSMLLCLASIPGPGELRLTWTAAGLESKP